MVKKDVLRKVKVFGRDVELSPEIRRMRERKSTVLLFPVSRPVTLIPVRSYDSD